MSPSPAWGERFATLLREVCGLYGHDHRRNMGWVKRAIERGAQKGITQDEIAAAIRGLHRIRRVNKPWSPCQMFSRERADLFHKAMAAGLELTKREPRHMQAELRAFAHRILEESR